MFADLAVWIRKVNGRVVSFTWISGKNIIAVMIIVALLEPSTVQQGDSADAKIVFVLPTITLHLGCAIPVRIFPAALYLGAWFTNKWPPFGTTKARLVSTSGENSAESACKIKVPLWHHQDRMKVPSVRDVSSVSIIRMSTCFGPSPVDHHGHYLVSLIMHPFYCQR